MKRVLLLVGAAVATLAASGWFAYQSWHNYLHSPLPLPADSSARFEIERGASLGQVALELHRRGWLERPRWFVLYARMRGETGSIRAGEYRIDTGMSPAQLLARFIDGTVVQHAFTIIEGATFADVRMALAADSTLKQTIAAMSDEQLMAALGRPGQKPEGMFLPETYYYAKGATDLDLLRRALQAMDRVLQEAWRKRPSDSVLETPYAALTLASIIEKETALDSERRAISGVFTRRLRKGMRLQSDPTVIYGLGERYDGNIRRRDLRSDTPYNTYTRTGLPPTPIAMPGRASIEAALDPQPGSALFFVATGEADGSHYFSDTLDEHNRAVQRYLTRLRQKP